MQNPKNLHENYREVLRSREVNVYFPRQIHRLWKLHIVGGYRIWNEKD